jgi:hypothetical protein
MHIWAVSSLILLIVLGTVFGFRQGGAMDSAQNSQSDSLPMAAMNEIEDKIILDDLPPPDDTYTPDQRRFS